MFQINREAIFSFGGKKEKSFAIENDQIFPYKINNTNTQTQGLLGDMTIIIKGKSVLNFNLKLFVCITFECDIRS